MCDKGPCLFLVLYIVSINLHRHTCLQYSKLFESQENYDVIFRVSLQRITAHRTVLATQSEYFNHLLFGNMREARNDVEIEMRDVSPFCFRLLLRYAYSGCVDLHNAQLQVSHSSICISSLSSNGVSDLLMCHHV